MADTLGLFMNRLTHSDINGRHPHVAYQSVLPCLDGSTGNIFQVPLYEVHMNAGCAEA